MKRGTRQKALPPPRNPHVAGALFRKAGSHGKSAKALRRANKVADRRAQATLIGDQYEDRLPDGTKAGFRAPTKAAMRFDHGLLPAL